MRLARVAVLAALVLGIGVPPASASVTLGQLGPNLDQTGAGGTDYAQQDVSTGNGYRVPGNGRITSWSTNACSTCSSQMVALEMFRKTRDPNFLTLIGHDGPRPLTAGLVNTFPANIPVEAGDLLGMNCTTNTATCTCSNSGTNQCSPLPNSGDTTFDRFPPPVLKDGDEASFFGPSGFFRLNISAVFTPSNIVGVGKTSFNKKKGTATLNLNLPNPGDLSASGNGVKASSAGAKVSKSVGAGPAQLLIKAKGKKKKTLNSIGKVKLSVAITYTPANGSPGTQSVKVKLKKKI